MLRSLSPLILLLCVQAHAAEVDPSRCAAIDDGRIDRIESRLVGR